jgi:NAD(P)H dehydrogenase (quinone)
MVTFEAAVREGFFDIISDDVERLTGRRPGTLRAMMEAHAAPRGQMPESS